MRSSGKREREKANEQRLNGQCIKTNVISMHSYEWDFGDWDVSYVPYPAKATRVATPHGRDAFTPWPTLKSHTVTCCQGNKHAHSFTAMQWQVIFCTSICLSWFGNPTLQLGRFYSALPFNNVFRSCLHYKFEILIGKVTNSYGKLFNWSSQSGSLLVCFWNSLSSRPNWWIASLIEGESQQPRNH